MIWFFQHWLSDGFIYPTILLIKSHNGSILIDDLMFPITPNLHGEVSQ